MGFSAMQLVEILIYISSLHVFVNKLLVNGYTDFYEIFLCLRGDSIMVWTNNSVQLKLFI